MHTLKYFFALFTSKKYLNRTFLVSAHFNGWSLVWRDFDDEYLHPSAVQVAIL